MRYKYSGVTKTRDNVNGFIEAEDETEARLKLRAMQVRPLTVAPAKGGGGGLFAGGEGKGKGGTKKGIQLKFGKAIDLKGLIIFTRQFSSLIDSGVPVVQCLDILAQQERRPRFRNCLKSVKEEIEGGSGLADAFGRHPEAFSDFFVRIVEAGEVSGTLDKALRRIAVQLERLGKIRSKVINAMIYPCITVVTAIGALVFLLVKVIPEISKLYTEGGADLPEITQNVLIISNWTQNNYGYLILALVGMVAAWPFLYKMQSFRRYWDPFVLKTPGFGPLIRKSSIARFTRTLATLIASGVPLINSFEICIKLIPNLTIQGILKNAVQSVTEGKSIASGLSNNNIFPPMVVHMVSIGEMTGRLDELLGKVADIYDDEIDDAVSVVTGLIQPVLIIFVGGLIAFLLMAMYLPIFQLAEKTMGGS